MNLGLKIRKYIYNKFKIQGSNKNIINQVQGFEKSYDELLGFGKIPEESMFQASEKNIK